MNKITTTPTTTPQGVLLPFGTMPTELYERLVNVGANGFVPPPSSRWGVCQEVLVLLVPTDATDPLCWVYVYSLSDNKGHGNMLDFGGTPEKCEALARAILGMEKIYVGW